MMSRLTKGSRILACFRGREGQAVLCPHNGHSLQTQCYADTGVSREELGLGLVLGSRHFSGAVLFRRTVK